MGFWDKKEGKRLFEKLPFYNTFIEKPKIEDLKNIDLLHELPFYDELNIEKISKAFKRCARGYKIEIMNSDPVAQLKASKLNIKDLLKNLLNEMNSFKYQITVKVLLKTQKEWRHRICSCFF